MCLTKLIEKLKRIKFIAINSLLSFICVGFLLFFVAVNLHGKNIKISFVVGDTRSKALVNLITGVEELKALPLEIKIYPRKGVKQRDLSFLLESDLIILEVMDRKLVNELESELRGALKRGAKIYAVLASGSYNEEMKNMGILYDSKIDEYYRQGGMENLKNLLYYCLNKDFGFGLEVKEPIKTPDFAIYDYKSKKIFENFEEYARFKGDEYFKKPLIGLVFYKSYYESGQTSPIDAIIESLEEEGFGVLAVYGFPSERAIERFFFDEKGGARVRAVVGLALKVGLNPKVAIPILSKLGVPVINAITLYSQSYTEWMKSPVGLDIFERSWQIALPELGGIIQPTVLASKEKVVDEETGLEYVEERPIPERVKRLTERVKAWINLQDKPNNEKRIAIIYYNYPPGKQNIGASYLNVLPESLWEIYERLKREGYKVEEALTKEMLFEDVLNYGRNIGNWAGGEIDKLARSGRAVLIPLKTYKEWFEALPEGFKKEVIKDWGDPEESKIMTWKGPDGKKYIILPGVQYGNIVFTPQPSRGWEQDPVKLYHNITLAPHHQYIAFYLWLKNEFKADAIAHIGKHGTHEWLSGKEVGFTEIDPPEVLISDLPNIYPYIVDDVGEGTQAKRRGMAVIIDHLTPPFDKATLNKELRELSGLISEYELAEEKSPPLAEAKLREINELAKKMGILTDLKLKEIKTKEEIEELADYLLEISEKITPFGLHIFGRVPEEKYIRTTAEAMLSLEKNLSEEEREKKLLEYEERIRISAQRELDSFIAALSGRYVPAGQGNDPVRNPDALPTGKNFYSFDPTKIPSKTTYEMGAKLATELIEDYKKRHGKYPDKLSFTLWATETIRHEGVMESQIMYLLGVKPKWDERGRVEGVEIIPKDILQRPRIDVAIVISGLYRDMFPNLAALIDKAVGMAKEQEEEDNYVRRNVLEVKKRLIEKGVKEELAERLATVRIFSAPPGAYGTNLDKVIPMSNTWETEKQVIDVYFMRESHLYGQGFWGDKVLSSDIGLEGKEDLSLYVFKRALSGSKIVLHSISGNVYATLDNDDYFQYLGGMAMAVRAIDGKTPEIYITNLTNPKKPIQETLEKFMGREMRSRYLNPEWIKAMMKEKYAGARFIDKVVEHLWGWQVTVPEAIDFAKWNEMYETYVLDKYGLGIKEMFRQAKNMWAYQSMVARMLETIRKGYWKPNKEVVETLAKEYAESVKEVGLACCDHTCNNPLLTKFTANVLISVPGLESYVRDFLSALKSVKEKEIKAEKQNPANKPLSKSLAPDIKGKIVEGYEMETINLSKGASSAPIPYLYIIFFLAFVTLITLGLRKPK
ncbi:MAG: cobaltochelatase subunit CobN [Caldimicrobium sp.]